MMKWIEKMPRLARGQAEKKELEPSLMEADNAVHGLETENRTLAQPPAGRAGSHPPQPDSAERGREHGVRGRTGGPGNAAGGTRTPGDATGYLETSLGVLSYAELAPHLARNVLALEKRIADGEFGTVPLDDALLHRFHGLICGDLVPGIAGWRRTNVTVGDHEPPDFFKVPVLVREYGLDLQSRIQAGDNGEILLETLAFAEGRLLSIHPFADFNGRAARVWLNELLRRIELPPVQLAPATEPARSEYLAALRAADRNVWRPLMEVWRGRFEGGETK